LIAQRFIFIFYFFIVGITYAQDTIVKRNNEIIAAKILEVNSNEIKYHLYNYKEGPVFILPKWELKSITYGNGVKENLDSIKPLAPVPGVIVKKDLSIITSGKYYFFQSNKITEIDMLEITKNINDKRLKAANKKTYELRFARKAFSIGAIGLGSFGLLAYTGIIPLNSQANTTPVNGVRINRRAAINANIAYRHTVGGYFMLAGLGLEAASLIINLNEIKYAHLTVKLYNKIILE
jgi:hypothetical protein